MREQSDLSKGQADQAAKLNKQLTEYLKAVNAQMPTPNPKYDPKAVPPPKKKGGKGDKDEE